MHKYVASFEWCEYEGGGLVAHHTALSRAPPPQAAYFGNPGGQDTCAPDGTQNFTAGDCDADVLWWFNRLHPPPYPADRRYDSLGAPGCLGQVWWQTRSPTSQCRNFCHRTNK